MSKILRMTSERSLVIIDEFGLAASQVEGSSLFLSAMQHWIEQGKIDKDWFQIYFLYDQIVYML